MSGMSELDIQLQRLAALDLTVRSYLAALALWREGAANEADLDRLHDELVELTSDELFEHTEVMR